MNLARVLLVLFTLLAPIAAAQEGWVSAAAATRFSLEGVTVSYGQRDLFGENADARFSATYFFSTPYGASGQGVELEASALSYTYEPDTSQERLYLIAYGGLGPRLLVQTGVYDYTLPDSGPDTAFLLNVGAVGGLEARLRGVGIFLELDISLPAVGVTGGGLRVFPFYLLPTPKLALGTNIYF